MTAARNFKIVSSASGEEVGPAFQSRVVTPVFFTLSILLASATIFTGLPIFSRSLLPLGGQTSMVWGATLVFLLCASIAGQLVGHLITRLPRIRHQIGLLFLIYVAGAGRLPLPSPENWTAPEALPLAISYLQLLTLNTGLPLLFLCASMPLIKTWYGRTNGPDAGDPYFMFGAAQVGGIIALLGYSLFADPAVPLGDMLTLWSWMYVVFGGGLLVSALLTLKDHPDAKTVPLIGETSEDLALLWRWASLSFMGPALATASSALLAEHMGPFSYIWTIPFSMYLLSFVSGFQATSLPFNIPHWLTSVALVVLALPLFETGLQQHVGGLLLISVALFICLQKVHEDLFEARPPASRLTVFFLAISIGSAAGAFLGNFVGYFIMDGHHEYPLALIALALAPLITGARETFSKGAAILAFMVFMVLPTLEAQVGNALLEGAFPYLALALALAAMFWRSTRDFAVIGFCALTAQTMIASPSGNILSETRSFYGAYQIVEKDGAISLLDGDTLHGGYIARAGTRPEPSGYHRRDGALGELLGSALWATAEEVAVLGVSDGSVLAYAKPWQKIHLFDQDRSLFELISNPVLLPYMSAYGHLADFHEGAPTRNLAQTSPRSLEVIYVDGFSRNLVPSDLLSREAVGLYLEKLDDDGALIIHLSERGDDVISHTIDALEYHGMKVFERRTYGRPDDPLAPTVYALVALRPDRAGDLFLPLGWVKR